MLLRMIRDHSLLQIIFKFHVHNLELFVKKLRLNHTTRYHFCERYHSIIRRVYNKLKVEQPDVSSLPPDQKSRIESMRIARKEMETITAQRRISLALKHRHGLKPNPPFQFGDKVRIWREDLNRFVGPYTVHGYDNEKTVYVMTDKIRPFSTSVVRLIPLEELHPERSSKQTGTKNARSW